MHGEYVTKDEIGRCVSTHPYFKAIVALCEADLQFILDCDAKPCTDVCDPLQYVDWINDFENSTRICTASLVFNINKAFKYFGHLDDILNLLEKFQCANTLEEGQAIWNACEDVAWEWDESKCFVPSVFKDTHLTYFNPIVNFAITVRHWLSLVYELDHSVYGGIYRDWIKYSIKYAKEHYGDIKPIDPNESWQCNESEEKQAQEENEHQMFKLSIIVNTGKPMDALGILKEAGYENAPGCYYKTTQYGSEVKGGALAVMDTDNVCELVLTVNEAIEDLTNIYDAWGVTKLPEFKYVCDAMKNCKCADDLVSTINKYHNNFITANSHLITVMKYRLPLPAERDDVLSLLTAQANIQELPNW